MPKIQDLEVDDILYRAVSIDPVDLQQEFVTLPADLAYWGARHADAHRAALKAKFALEQAEAKTRLFIREQLNLSGQKATVDEINARVIVDEFYAEARLAAIETESVALRYRNLLSSVHAKKDMLVSVGAQVRAEMDGNPSLRRQINTIRDVESTK